MDATIQRANEKITFLANDREAMRLYEMREMALSDYTSGINNARQTEKIEIAKSLLKDDINIAFIIKHTGLDETTIMRLEAELNND